MNQTADLVLAILAELECADMPGHTKFKLKEFISAACVTAGVTAVERSQRVEYARQLLDDQIDRAVVRDRLIARFGIQRSQAYREIRSALNLCHNGSKFGTTAAQNSST